MQLASAKFLGCALAVLVLALPAQAGFISGGPTSPNQSGLGRFLAEFTVASTGADSATLTIRIVNTSLTAGSLNGFVFNNPDSTEPIAYSLALISAPSGFNTFLNDNNNVGGTPYGQFDFGVTTGGSFQGPGNVNTGLQQLQSASFVFSVSGVNAGSLTDNSFLNQLSVPPGLGDGGAQFFVARFQGFTTGAGSDKVAAVRGLDAGGGSVGGFGGPEVFFKRSGVTRCPTFGNCGPAASPTSHGASLAFRPDSRRWLPETS